MEWLSVGWRGSERFRLATGNMAAPLKALRTCTDELVTHWGIDVERHRQLSRRPMPRSNPGRWLTSSDYPLGALSSGKQALVRFRLMVDEEGKPTACRIQHSIGDEAFDRVSCERLMARASFQPGLDGEGRPLASYYVNAVRFMIP